MSTTTVVDLTDAQMLDYAVDGDFSMHNSPAEWLAIEATMSDDNPAATDYSEPIEIDMEAGDGLEGDITEYEMADGVGDDVDFDGDAQLQDARAEEVQQLEPSLVINPPPAQVVDAADTVPHQVPTESLHTFSPLAGVSEIAPDIATLASGLLAATAVETGGSLAEHAPDVPPLHLEVHETPHNGEVTSDILSHEGLDSLHTNPQSVAHVDPPAIIVLAPSNDVSHADDSIDANIAVPEAPAGHVTEGLTLGDRAAPEEGHEGYRDTSGDPLRLEVDSQSTEHVGVAEVDAVSASGHLGELATEGDPHEIGDGVYIDPPPAVLLTIPGHNSNDLCLFNLPTSESQSREASPSQEATLLLLQQLPTLYYEPLSAVFAALRQEELIHSIPHFASSANELTIEASDLGLVFPEDNVFVQEVTLHDLNVIHDDARLPGPLRLRLSSSPRFILRYRALRDQIAQLTLETEANAFESEKDAEGDAGYQESTELQESDEPENHNAQIQSEQHADGVTGGEIVDEFSEHQELAQEAADELDYHVPPEGGLDDGVAGADDNAADGEAPEDPSSAVEYGTELTTEEDAEGPEPDEIHHTVGADDGDEYTDHAENAGDDEEQYEDTPPEDLGGDTEDAVEPTTAEIVEKQDSATTPQPAVPELAAQSHDEAYTADQLDQSPERHGVADSGIDRDEQSKDDFTEETTEADSGEVEYLQDYDESQADEFNDLGDLEDGNWELDEEEELNDPHDTHEDTLSKQSSETLSTLSSKRSRDEDDEDDGTLSGSVPESPGSKRVRTH